MAFSTLLLLCSARHPGCNGAQLNAVHSNEDKMDKKDAIERASQAKKGSPFLNAEQAAFYLGLCPRKLQYMRSEGTGPRFRRHSRYVRYHIDDLDSWSRGTTKDGTGDA